MDTDCNIKKKHNADGKYHYAKNNIKVCKLFFVRSRYNLQEDIITFFGKKRNI